jgi:hypothetical protein
MAVFPCIFVQVHGYLPLFNPIAVFLRRATQCPIPTVVTRTITYGFTQGSWKQHHRSLEHEELKPVACPESLLVHVNFYIYLTLIVSEKSRVGLTFFTK